MVTGTDVALASVMTGVSVMELFEFKKLNGTLQYTFAVPPDGDGDVK